jgi:integrase
VLTDKEIRAAEPREKDYRLADGQGLHLQVTTRGSKLWRYRYEFPAGREKMLALGKYPSVGLGAARKAREAARALLDQGKDPSVERRAARIEVAEASENTFEVLARAWIERETPHWVPRHRKIALRSLEADAFPALGKLPINRITPPMVLAVLRAVEKRGAVDMAARLRQRMSAVFVYAIAAGVGENDPAAIVAGALSKRVKGQQPAVGTLEDARAVLAAVEGTGALATSHLAHRFLALTAVRQNEMTNARWEEMEGLDGPEPLWRIPKERMKGRVGDRREHLVPLARQSVEILEQAKRLAGKSPFVFPSHWGRTACISAMTLLSLMNRAGLAGKHVPHGWRSSFSTIMNEVHQNEHDRAVIDLMLAHKPKTGVEAVYNRAKLMARRRELAQEWADLLLEGRPEAAALVG